MPMASLVTGIIAAGYMIYDGEVSLERMAAILTGVAAAWVLLKRTARRFWQMANPGAPESSFPLNRLVWFFLRSLSCRVLLVTIPPYRVHILVLLVWGIKQRCIEKQLSLDYS
jgi:hypothetical protein